MKIEPSAFENGYVPVDIDVTPFDNSKTKKEGVSRTYKGFDGFAPIMAYMGTEGYFVNTQLCMGKQHCQKETPDFLRETIVLCRQLTDKPLLIRLDSGNDESENIGIFMEESYRYNKVSFIIKRNPRHESKGEWQESVRDCCADIQKPRDGKTVYVGQTFRNVTYTLPDKTEKQSVSGQFTRLLSAPLTGMGSSSLFQTLNLTHTGRIVPCQIRKSLVYIIPMEGGSSTIVRSRLTWTLKGCHPENLKVTSWCLNWL